MCRPPSGLARVGRTQFKGINGLAVDGKHLVVFANEKGGTGKSTTAVHVAVGLAKAGWRVGLADLDSRQRTADRYIENRHAIAKRRGIHLASPDVRVLPEGREDALDGLLEDLAARADIVLVDTPGRDDPFARAVAGRADTLVTPMNDSFVDLDLIGSVDADSFKVTRPSFYAETIWDARKVRAKMDGGTVDWVVLRNRLQQLEARNMKRVAAAMIELSKRVGFRVIPGLSERVVYRELFPKGLTLLDIDQIRDVGMSHVTARSELRALIAGLKLPARPGEGVA